MNYRALTLKELHRLLLTDPDNVEALKAYKEKADQKLKDDCGLA